ncbi:MAG: glutamate--tRNA ligase [Candidatus Baldrarchaeia archaeon]
MREREVEENIMRLALMNAIKYGGKAKAKAVLGKLLATFPELKSEAKELAKLTEEIVKKVNEMSSEEQKKLLEKLSPLEVPKAGKKEEKKLPPLPNVERWRKVVMRLAPFPSGPLHIGNARMAVLNDEYVKMYSGKLLLVYDDTIGSEEKRIVPEAYEMIKEGLNWLGVKYHKTIYKSDRLPIFYKYCEELLKRGHAYVCLCDAEEWRTKYKITGIPCPHRSQSVEENLEHWDKMLDGTYGEGEAVVRIKSGMDLEDPALRDHVIMRISEREHPRVGMKYRVWPLLEFSWAIDDHLLGITHILRGKDLIKEDRMEQIIWKFFGWPIREFVHYGKISFKGAVLSKSKARMLIERKILRGWDDPRTWSLQSLAKRGIRPEALREYLLSLGLSLTDVEFDPSSLYAYNRRLIDPEAPRYFFVREPYVLLKVHGIPDSTISVQLPYHPNVKKFGARTINVRVIGGIAKFVIPMQDIESIMGKGGARLKGLLNFEVVKFVKEKRILISKFQGYDVGFAKSKSYSIIQWVLPDKCIDVEIIMPDGTLVKGVGEYACKHLTVDQVIQFERFGFVRVDRVSEDKILCYYAHD